VKKRGAQCLTTPFDGPHKKKAKPVDHALKAYIVKISLSPTVSTFAVNIHGCKFPSERVHIAKRLFGNVFAILFFGYQPPFYEPLNFLGVEIFNPAPLTRVGIVWGAVELKILSPSLRRRVINSSPCQHVKDIFVPLNAAIL